MLLLLPLQTFGLVHVVADLTAIAVTHAVGAEAAPCSHEQDGERCPPDCASCHCGPLVQALFPTPASVVPPRVSFAPPPGDGSPSSLSSRSPPLGLERPPRQLPSFVS